MKTSSEDWAEAFLDLEDYPAEQAMQNATLEAIRRARRCGTSHVIFEDGRMKALTADETGPYEQRGLINLDPSNRKIAELQNLSTETLAMNDRPAQK